MSSAKQAPTLLDLWWKSKGKERFGSLEAFATALGATRQAVRFWRFGIEFPRDENCVKLYEITEIACYGPAERDRARAMFVQAIPAEVKKKRQAQYQANPELYRGRALKSWRKRYERQRVKVPDEELATLRKDPRARKSVCRECGEILADVGPHLWPEHKMKAAQYKEKWGFLRSRNATRSEETNEKQSRVMKRIRQRPPKWTREFLPRAQEASLCTNQPDSARLEERLNMRGRKLDSRPEHWKHTPDGKAVTDARIAQLRLRGHSQPEISVMTGLSLTPVFNRLKRMGFPRRARLFLHGGIVSVKHFSTLCSDFELTAEQAAERIGLSADWAKRLMRRTANDPLSPKLGREVLKLYAELKTDFRKKPSAGKRGGRPSQLTPSERAGIPETYDALLSELKALRGWIQEQDKRLSNNKVWDHLCEEFRSGRFVTLKTWPQFFTWIEEGFTGSLFRDGDWVPNQLAIQYLADDYGASESAIYEVLHRAVPSNDAVTAQAS